MTGSPLEEINTRGKSLFGSLIDHWEASSEEPVNICCAYTSICEQKGGTLLPIWLSIVLCSVAEQEHLKIDTTLLIC